MLKLLFFISINFVLKIKIVANFGVEYGAGKGRSGGGYMSVDYRPFKVNSQYAGTVDDNFITRAFEKKDRQIAAAINKGLR